MQNFILTDNITESSITDFLLKEDRARVYHHPAWLKSLTDSYGGKPFYLLVKKEGSEDILGLAPFILLNQESINNQKVVSLPFTNYCDYILPGNTDIKLILDYINTRLGPISEFDLRVLDEIPIAEFSNLNDFLVHIIELKPTLEETYNSFGRRSIRRFIRKADENNLQFRLGETEDDLKIFYDLEVKLRKSIGLPPAPYHFFYNIWTNFKKQNMIFLPIVSFESEPIAASVVLHYKDRIYFEYTGLNKKHKNLYGNHKIHWEMIKIAQNELNARFVDLGRVSIDHESLIFFKENWKAQPFKVYHKRFPSQAKENLIGKVLNLSYPLIQNINKKLPDSLIKLEGRIIYKYLKILLFCCLYLS